MPALKRIDDERIVRVLSQWGGNISAAAEELGIHRNNLQSRIVALRIDVTAMRAQRSATNAPQRNAPDAVPSLEPYKATAGQSRSAIYPKGTEPPTFVRMQSAEATQELESPVRTVRTRPQPTRLKPAQQDQLREAKFDFQAAFRVDTDENAILQQFFDECFDAWKHGKLAEGR